ncbi:hypothetical protein Pmar_PMAR023364 [Perkinsus marinus ATCC 50983]|uniref:Uncharacterized protein n=1 Tax=Perkinsus marinus (strain ATCC 50983 / TXsc) TaxID=423536 RepID=C5KKC8_PERM5|nr:hypothetical protein Pmar_PMAR023364 [Perkinsus marinus ATCC 50983]EER15040.1 hypothetical protein Pmar_PMAR023364 [Perkinsus marinus ATCC 50983]|eukprot:XP_002783244.1 hypothetical protein Pmar_PMAR023364 [Perkinsus marinus ATCC 50983]
MSMLRHAKNQPDPIVKQAEMMLLSRRRLAVSEGQNRTGESGREEQWSRYASDPVEGRTSTRDSRLPKGECRSRHKLRRRQNLTHYAHTRGNGEGSTLVMIHTCRDIRLPIQVEAITRSTIRDAYIRSLTNWKPVPRFTIRCRTNLVTTVVIPVRNKHGLNTGCTTRHANIRVYNISISLASSKYTVDDRGLGTAIETTVAD